MTNKTIKPMILAAVLSISTFANAAGNPELSCISQFVKEMRIVQSLNLTALQKQSLVSFQELMSSHRQAVYEQNNMQQEIVSLLTEPTLDQEKAVALVKMRTAQVDEFAPVAITALARFTDSLSTEQRDLIKNRINDLQQNCDNSLGAFLKQLRTKVSAKLNILIPALSLESTGNTSTEYWADLQYSGTNNEGKPSWTLNEFGENK